MKLLWSTSVASRYPHLSFYSDLWKICLNAFFSWHVQRHRPVHIWQPFSCAPLSDFAAASSPPPGGLPLSYGCRVSPRCSLWLLCDLSQSLPRGRHAQLDEGHAALGPAWAGTPLHAVWCLAGLVWRLVGCTPSPRSCWQGREGWRRTNGAGRCNF